MFNPNYIYTFIFVVVVAMYQLGWSNLYPKLTTPLLVFLIATILINFAFGFFVNRFNKLRFKIIETKEKNGNSWIVILILLILWGIDKFFGDIPTIHILLITFTSFYSIHVFSRYLRELGYDARTEKTQYVGELTENEKGRIVYSCDPYRFSVRSDFQRMQQLQYCFL